MIDLKKDIKITPEDIISREKNLNRKKRLLTFD